MEANNGSFGSRAPAGWSACELPNDIQERALMKLQQLHAAEDLKDLLIPVSNQLEALKGDRKGEHSVRVNEQWRICFEWDAGHASDVEITDYH
jgi:proteic killer suppression protein